MTANPDLTIWIRDMPGNETEFYHENIIPSGAMSGPGRRSFSVEVVDVPVILVQQVVVDLFSLALGKFG